VRDIAQYIYVYTHTHIYMYIYIYVYIYVYCAISLTELSSLLRLLFETINRPHFTQI